MGTSKAQVGEAQGGEDRGGASEEEQGEHALWKAMSREKEFQTHGDQVADQAGPCFGEEQTRQGSLKRLMADMKELEKSLFESSDEEEEPTKPQTPYDEPVATKNGYRPFILAILREEKRSMHVSDIYATLHRKGIVWYDLTDRKDTPCPKHPTDRMPSTP